VYLCKRNVFAGVNPLELQVYICFIFTSAEVVV